MSDVNKVFITSEVAQMLDVSPSYLLRVAKELELSSSEFRIAGKRNCLFSEEAIKKLLKRKEDMK